ncbi:MAG: class I SAM-dependent methyltransferase [Acidimicrobiaceae bacterium]|nr:class I SAM-dependent methyltransferase [Acidimicrobiaceae bacterium]
MTRQSTVPDAAKVAGPLIEMLFGRVPINFEFWDGSNLTPKDPAAKDGIANVRLRSADALRHLLWSPNELGMARAFVTGEMEVEGDIFEAFRALRLGGTNLPRGLRVLPRVLTTAFRLGLIGRPLPPPPEEMHPRGKLHSFVRDAKVVRHHYDISNDFYRIVLGSSMTYSCALFTDSAMSLAEAQVAKNDLVCRKLGLNERPGMRLLDVGCGWGSMALHAARHYDARVVGVTISREQFKAATRLVEQAGLAGRVEIRLEDYRLLRGERFDAISSIGMSEHVGKAKIGEYFSTLTSLLSPQGRILNHAISSVGGSKLDRRTFMYRYVFPDGELLDVGKTVLAMEDAGLEVRDVDSLREHYALTLRAWVANLESQWDTAVALVGVGRARVWRLYMAASAVGFEEGSLAIHQVLGVLPTAIGTSGIDLERKYRNGH